MFDYVKLLFSLLPQSWIRKLKHSVFLKTLHLRTELSVWASEFSTQSLLPASECFMMPMMWVSRGTSLSSFIRQTRRYALLFTRFSPFFFFKNISFFLVAYSRLGDDIILRHFHLSSLIIWLHYTVIYYNADLGREYQWINVLDLEKKELSWIRNSQPKIP